MTIRKELLDELIGELKNPEDFYGNGGLIAELTRAITERVLEGELTHHLGYEKNSSTGTNSGNSRNGKTTKTVKGKNGELNIVVPRDRNGSFAPQLIKKRQSRFDGFDEKIIALYARGMTTRDIQAQLAELYGVEVSPSFISTVTDAILPEVTAWQNRPLESLYPVVFLDAIRIKSRAGGSVQNMAVYIALGVKPDGMKEVLGMWIAKSEGAKFWLGVLTDMKNRGLQDIFIATVDGLKGFPDAIATVYPRTQVQLCIVHMIRNSLKYVSWKQRKQMADDLKTIYQAATKELAASNLDAFAKQWDDTYPTVSKAWYTHWENLIPFFDYPQEVRKILYTTNAIESLNFGLRKVTKNRGSFPNEEAVFKLLYLALMNMRKKWTGTVMYWKQAMNQFEILFENRIIKQ
jgi:putative transposase